MSLWLPEDELLKSNSDLLAQTLERYRRILGGNGYAFWEWGLHDNSYRCGGSFWEKLGYVSSAVDEEVTSVDNVQDYVHPDDFPVVYEVVLDHLKNNTPIDMIYRIRAKDGTYWWTQASASSTRDENGRVTYISGVNFDLSHLKETEKALRLSEARHERILAASNDGIWEWSVDSNDPDDENGRFHTSHSCWQHLGYSQEEVDALPEDERLSVWCSHVHPHDLVKMQLALKRHFKHGKPFDIEYRMFGSDGETFWMRSRGQALIDGQGRAILMSGINIDITQVKLAEERVRKAKDDAEKANQAKSDFLSNMSHELRTPLNAIMGFSQLTLNDKNSSAEQQDRAGQVHNAGSHLLQLINDVLDMAKIEAGIIAFEMAEILPGQVIRECFSLIESMASDKGIQLSLSILCDENITVHADPVKLKQSLLNLLSNAVKYNVPGGKVRVVVMENPRDASVIDIKVEDTGPGISEAKIKQLFQPFNRLGAEASQIEGSGIGLALTKALVNGMGGDIEYTAGQEGGACFVICLNRGEAALAHKSSGRSMEGSSQSLILDLSGQHQIAYIEDNPSNIRLMEAVLNEYQQIDLNCYEDPMVGLYHIRQKAPDLVLLDMNLPETNGVKLMQIIKSNPDTRNIPIIALSANAIEGDVENAIKAGFDHYLTKPIEINQLITTLSQCLKKMA